MSTGSVKVDPGLRNKSELEIELELEKSEQSAEKV